MVSEFMVMFVAGTDTTSHVIHNILLYLDNYKEIKQKVLEEMDLFIKDNENYEKD